MGCPVGPLGAAVGEYDGDDVGGIVISEPLAKVTAAMARPRPRIVEVEPYVIDTFASILPTKLLEYEIVALVPTDQYTLAARAPFLRIKEVAVLVVTVVPV